MEETAENGHPVKYYRLSEIEERNTFKCTWIIIQHNIYDVTQFLEEVRQLALQTLYYFSQVV